MKTPNIFDYATGELSQDAFICWLISWLRYDKNSDEYNVAKKLIIRLYDRYLQEHKKELKVELNENSIIELMGNSPKKQYFKSDIYFELLIINQNELLSFIIEDKVWITVHSDQLNRYVDAIKKETSNEIIKIYYKTGYIFHDDEKKPRQAGFVIINSEWIYKFLINNRIDHPIYIDYIERNFYIPQFVELQTIISKVDG